MCLAQGRCCAGQMFARGPFVQALLACAARSARKLPLAPGPAKASPAATMRATHSATCACSASEDLQSSHTPAHAVRLRDTLHTCFAAETTSSACLTFRLELLQGACPYQALHLLHQPISARDPCRSIMSQDSRVQARHGPAGSARPPMRRARPAARPRAEQPRPIAAAGRRAGRWPRPPARRPTRAQLLRAAPPPGSKH